MVNTGILHKYDDEIDSDINIFDDKDNPDTRNPREGVPRQQTSRLFKLCRRCRRTRTFET